MGGGGGWGLSKEDLKKLEEIAKENLKIGAQPSKRNVFISFVNEDIKEVNLLRGQAMNENNELEFNDWSLKDPFNSEHADYIRRGIRERIRQCSVTIVYLSDKTAKSKWVNWEINESVKLGRPVIGVFKGDSPPRRLPSVFIEHGCKLVRWTHEGLASAIAAAASEKR